MEFRPAFFGFELTRAIGLMLIIAGVPGVVGFRSRGLHCRGWERQPRSRRHRSWWSRVSIATCEIRFTSGSLLSFFGQAVLFGDWRLLWYAALLWLFFHVFVLVYEEPTLKQTFGARSVFSGQCPALGSTADPWQVP